MNSNNAVTTDNLLTVADLMQKHRLSRKTICTYVRAGNLRAVPMPDGSNCSRPAETENRLASQNNRNKEA